MSNWEEIARASAKWHKDAIVLIPDDCVIDPQYLGSMTNQEYVAVFKYIQELIIRIYEDVEKAPFEWGYPQENNTTNLCAAAYYRVSDFFLSLMKNGIIEHDTFIVDKKGFKANLKKHKSIDSIKNKLIKFGFAFDHYEDKSATFTVSYSFNPLIFPVLLTYANSNAQDYQIYQTGADFYEKFGSFSYRWVEDPKCQKHEPIFLMKMDMSPKELQHIGYWLYDQAKAHGFTINKKKPFDKSCVYYTKGSKSFLPIGEKSGDHGDKTVFIKAIFRRVFESNPEDIKELINRFPDSIGHRDSLCNLCDGNNNKSFDKPCSMRITYEIGGRAYRSCAYRSFYFYNPTPEDVKLILKLYMIENKIK